MLEIALEEIIRILRESKEDGSLKDVESEFEDLLQEAGAEKQPGDWWSIDRELRIELALRAVSIGAVIEDIVNLLNWKDFEGLVASILMEHEYKCVESFRRRGTSDVKGMEIDVIGRRGSNIVSVDAKMWGSRAGKASALKPAAEKQKERTKRLCGLMTRLATKIGVIPNGRYSLKPVLVTWMVEEVVFHEGVPIVPVFKLNSFLQDIAIYDDMISASTCIFNG